MRGSALGYTALCIRASPNSPLCPRLSSGASVTCCLLKFLFSPFCYYLGSQLYQHQQELSPGLPLCSSSASPLSRSSTPALSAVTSRSRHCFSARAWGTRGMRRPSLAARRKAPCSGHRPPGRPCSRTAPNTARFERVSRGVEAESFLHNGKERLRWRAG